MVLGSINNILLTEALDDSGGTYVESVALMDLFLDKNQSDLMSFPMTTLALQMGQGSSHYS